MDRNNVRQEYPRPDFERERWKSLNGEWDFAFDDGDRGEDEGWYRDGNFDKKILVPFCYQSRLSGVHDTANHDQIWYLREFDLPGCFTQERILLHFGAVDYAAKVWLNGVFLGIHRGGHTPFQFDITRYVLQSGNRLVVKAEDGRDCDRPRGKQYWKEKPQTCWYTPTSGIWQSVWLESVGTCYIRRIKLTPDIDRRELVGEITLSEAADCRLSVNVWYEGRPAGRLTLENTEKNIRFLLSIREEDFVDEIHYWTPESPRLYDITLTLEQNGVAQDCVKSYFGMRKISVKGDMILLNNRPYYQKLVLDQGYWPDSLMTPPCDDAIRRDIELAKELGFNGARKHQKIEDPRYYYWADTLGLIVWEELPSAYSFTDEAMENSVREWTEVIDRDYNHPCVITWVPLNESWGVRNIVTDERQQNYARALYFITKSLDATRLVSSNDGWEQICESDICGIHDYAAAGEDFLLRYLNRESLVRGDAQGRLLYCRQNQYKGQPVILSEFGGISFESGDGQNFGYSGYVKTPEEFMERYRGLVRAIEKIPYIRGWCYTQLTDVMQETNGLLTADRVKKC